MSDFKFPESFDLDAAFDEAFRPFFEFVDELKAGSTAKDQVLLPKPPVDFALASLIPHPSVILIVGHRGSGKSALAVRIQELKQDIAPPYAIGLPPKAARLLPQWYGLTDNALDVPPNATIYLPESYLLFHARATQSAQGRAVGELVNPSRHRRHSLIFDVQNPAHLDRNIISEADVILVKEPGPLTQGFERPQLRPIMDAARAAFAGVGRLRRKRAVWVYAPNEGVTGQLMENLLPTFWTQGLSRIFADAAPGKSHLQQGEKYTDSSLEFGKRARPRKGQRNPTEARKAKAKQLREQGFSYSEIGRILGVGKSQAFRMVNG
ncbi:MAG: helix-turn-helix domain-containing protein [Chloroflexi bacterium]|nr:helix-turn-helix domain-containing protein [Chloroflexota bacterium]